MTNVAMIKNVPAGSEGAEASTPAIRFKGWAIRVEWVAIEKLKAERIALNGISDDEFNDLMQVAEVEAEFGFTSGQGFVDDKVVFEIEMKEACGDETTEMCDHKPYNVGDHTTYYLVTEDVYKGRWKVEERTSQGFERSKLSPYLSTVAVNGFECLRAIDLYYDGQEFVTDDGVGTRDTYLLDPTGRKIDFDIFVTNSQLKLL